MTPVQGKNGIIFFNIDGTFVEFGCVENISFDSVAEIIETSTVGAGTAKTYAYQATDYDINLTSLVLNESDKITAWDMLQQQQNFLSPPFRIIYTEDNGATKTVSGSVLIPSLSLSADQTDLMTSTITLKGTGQFIVLTEEAPFPVINIVVSGVGTGAIQSLVLRTPDLLDERTLTGPFNIGTTETWNLDGAAGNMPPGSYYVEAVASVGTGYKGVFSTNAPPTGSVDVNAPGEVLDVNPFGNSILYDFTATRTISFVVSDAPNVGPIANAGADQTITLPTNSVTVNGSSSSDPDGSIVSYLWSYVSGPSSWTIVTSTSVSTVISGLLAGTYVFRLTVTDNDGATGTDDITIVVQPATVPVITIEVTGTGTGESGAYVQLINPATMAYYTSPSFNLMPGTTLTWPLDGAGGNPPPGASYVIGGYVTSNEPFNTMITNAPPNASELFVGGGQSLMSLTYPTTFDFTTSRTITFRLGS